MRENKIRKNKLIVNFTFNIDNDIKNIYNTYKNPTAYDYKFVLPVKISEIISNKDLKDCKDKLIEYNSNIYSSKNIVLLLNTIREYWRRIEQEYIKRLEIITKRKFDIKKVTAYGITIGRCPYNPKDKSYSFPIFGSLLQILKTSGHEIFHLHFHKYFFENIKREVGEESAHDIKEAITTALLNLEFKDLWLMHDQGYEKHAALIKLITIEWNKNKNFELLLKKCIDYTKLLKGGNLKLLT
ncbi:MAG: hypothetical protein AABX07_05450 [Nanoarchaeota archaeon]